MRYKARHRAGRVVVVPRLQPPNPSTDVNANAYTNPQLRQAQEFNDFLGWFTEDEGDQ